MTSFIDDDGNELQYNGDDFALTKQVITVFDLIIRSNVSVNIKIPGTSKNRDILNFYRFNQVGGGQLAGQTFNLVKNGNKIDRGSIILLEDDGKMLTMFFVSGNYKWFSSLDFRCNEIRTTRWDVRWNNYYVKNLYNATEGIIFPIIDWNYRHEKFSKYISDQIVRIGDGSDGATIIPDNYLPETYPCLYIHTLVRELANHSQINIGGTLITDGFFKKLIITPQGANFKDPTTGEQIFQGNGVNITGNPAVSTTGPIIKPEMIAPDMKALDFIKWLSVSFGCIVSYEEITNTINLDLLSKLDKDDADDWSEYYRSHTEQYKDVKKNNYILYKASDDEEIQDYNDFNSVPFGGINAVSSRDDDSRRTLYTMPFPAVLDKVGSANLRMATPYVPFVTLSDGDAYLYTSVTDNGAGAGTAPDNRRLVFNGTGFPFNGLNTINNIVRIVDDNGLYDGFHTGDPIAASGPTVYQTKGRFLGTSTGTIYIQSAQKHDNQFVLVVVPNITPADITMSADIAVSGTSVTTIATAYFSKPYTPYANLNVYNKGLALDDINLDTYNDISLKEAYLNPITNALIEPTLKVKMVLPVDVFASFTGRKLIYLNVGELNGYFIVQKIEQYKDNLSEVNVYISNYS